MFKIEDIKSLPAKQLSKEVALERQKEIFAIVIQMLVDNESKEATEMSKMVVDRFKANIDELAIAFIYVGWVAGIVTVGGKRADALLLSILLGQKDFLENTPRG